MADVTIRPAVLADLDPLVELWCELNRAGASADGRYRLRDDFRDVGAAIVRDTWMDESATHVLVAADRSGRLVGFVATKRALEHPVLSSPATVVFTDMFVAADHRRAGVGRLLFEEACLRARADGVEAFEVGTLALDSRAVAFWRSVGFVDWRVTMSRHAVTTRGE